MRNQLLDRLFVAYLEAELETGSEIPVALWEYYEQKAANGWTPPPTPVAVDLPQRPYAASPCPKKAKKLGVTAADDAYWPSKNLTHDVIYNWKDGVDLVIID